MHIKNQSNNLLDSTNLKILETQLNYESIMNKKLNEYAKYFIDPQLQYLCRQGAQRHKDNFENLLNYLNTYNE